MEKMYLNNLWKYDKINRKEKEFLMKKVFNKFGFAFVAMLIAVPAFAAGDMQGLCDLIAKLQGIFKILRILAFVGAGFFIATWAWEYISKPQKDSASLIGDIKSKGTSMLVGFLLLFMIGVVLSAVISMAGPDGALGCVEQLTTGW